MDEDTPETPTVDEQQALRAQRTRLIADLGHRAMATAAANDNEMLGGVLTITLNVFSTVVAAHPEFYAELAGKLDLIKFAIMPSEESIKQ